MGIEGLVVSGEPDVLVHREEDVVLDGVGQPWRAVKTTRHLGCSR